MGCSFSEQPIDWSREFLVVMLQPPAALPRDRGFFLAGTSLGHPGARDYLAAVDVNASPVPNRGQRPRGKLVVCGLP